MDVTVDLVGDRPKAQYVATVMKGQNLAEQISGIDDFIDGLNARAAGQPVLRVGNSDTVAGLKS